MFFVFVYYCSSCSFHYNTGKKYIFDFDNDDDHHHHKTSTTALVKNIL